MSIKVKLILTAYVLLVSGAAAAGDVLVYTGEGGINYEGYADFGAATGKTIDTQDVLPGDLSVYDCIVLPANGTYDTAFSAPTLAALNVYVNAGGRIIAEAEWLSFSPGGIAAMNGLAADLGADLSVVGADLDTTPFVTPNIDLSPFTAGVSTIAYAATSEIAVAVGPFAQSLVRTLTESKTFIGADQIGNGLFVLLGDSNVFSDNNFGGYIGEDNGVLAANLCDQVSIVPTPTLVLTPPGAYNLTGTSHTVKATLNGIARCEVENVDALCTSDDDCGDAGTCSNKAGIPVGFLVSGVNNIDTAVDDQTTDENGQVSYTYDDTGGPGSDSIQACADLFVDPYEATSECIGEAPYDPTDIASNTVMKYWGEVNLALTPESAYNPIGTTHVLTATSAGLPTKCSSDPSWPFVAECSSDADCIGVGGSCDLAGYPTFFAVVGECSGGSDGGEICTHDEDCDSAVCTGGPNLGDIALENTDGGGVATASYSSTVEGEDRIMACLDGDPYGFGIGDEIVNEFIWCFNDAQYEFDVPSNAVTKGWFANFITGGAGTYATANRKKTMQFSGVIGKGSTEPGIHGQWNAVAKDGATGKTVSCHFNSFTKLVFSGPPAKTPASTHNTATWTTGPGKCNDGSEPILTATAVDFGEGKKLPRDTINVKGDPRFDTGGTKALTTGNLQVHSIILP